MTVALPAAVQAVFDATNKGDTSAFLDAFTDDGVVDDWGREFRGRDAIKSWSDGENIGVHAVLTPTSVTSSGVEYVVTADVAGGGFNGPSHFTFRVEGERVARMTIRA
jgi:ketosteroid isomerase-like protein